MMNYKDRVTRLQIIVEYCLKNSITPQKNNFADIVVSIEVSKMGRTAKQASEDVNILCIAYRTEKWKSYTTEDTENTNEQVNIPKVDIPRGTPPDIKETIKKITAGPHEKIHHQATKESIQIDRLSEEQEAKILYNMAQKDIFDGVGRIILPEARRELDNKALTCQDIATLWLKYYPIVEVEQKSNVLLIYFEGKDRYLQEISKRPPIIPEKFKNPKTDIIDVTKEVR
jgi:hypothetical protein